MSFTNYLELEVLDHVFGSGVYTPPAALYVGLSTTTPTESGTNFTEPGSGYARMYTPNDKNAWTVAGPAGGSGSLNNKTGITWGTVTGSWGTVTSFGLWDSLVAGNLLVHGGLTSSQQIVPNSTVSFASGSLVIRLE